MRSVAFALLLAQSGSVNGGWVDGESRKLRNSIGTYRGRSLIETSQGTWLENSYIASSHGDCHQLKTDIALFKKGHNFVNVENFEDEEIDFEKVCFVAFQGSEEVAEYVKNYPGVYNVEHDMMAVVAADPKSWGLNRIDQENLPLSVGIDFICSHTGKDVNIYILDTGVYAQHSDFGTRATYGMDYIQEGSQNDLNGHGTHCAGTAAGGSYGIARDANIIGVKVLGGDGSGSWSSVINGVKWAVSENGGKAGVISMSLGGFYSGSVNDAVNAAANAGMIVTVAAGNSNDDACYYSPASAGGNGKNGGVITVGATDINDNRASYSNYGDCVDILAPGSSIVSTFIGGSTASMSLSGTSMAAPHVAGLAAVLLEKHNGDKAAAITEMFAISKPNVISSVQGSPNLLLQTPRIFSTAAPTFSPTTGAPTLSPTTAAPTTAAPTFSPTTGAPTLSPTTAAPTTGAPTLSPTTGAPTFSPTTAAPTTGAPTFSPTTGAPTSAPTLRPTKSAPTPRPTKSCSEMRKRECRRSDECEWLRVLHNNGRYECVDKFSTYAPTSSSSLVDTGSCDTGNYNRAIEVCEDLGARLCSANELDSFSREEIGQNCGFDNSFIWTSDSCARGRRVVAYKYGSRQVCRYPSRRTENAILCCA